MGIQLVQVTNSFAFQELIVALTGLMEPFMEVLPSVYGTETRLAMVYVENRNNGQGMRIIFDPNRIFADRQGVHTSIEIDEYELAEKLERGFDDGFDTIWVHND